MAKRETAMIIYIDTPFKEEQKTLLRSTLKADELIFKDELPSDDERLSSLLKADILLGNPKPVDWLQQAQNLKWLQLYSTGFEYYSGVKIPAVVTNMKAYYAQPCAETIVAGIMALYRGIDKYDTLKSQGRWVGYQAREKLQLLFQKKVIILGAGGIAKHLGNILSGFDCGVTFFARSAGEATLHTIEDLEKAIPDADIIIGTLPGTKETAGLFTTAMINKMNADALFCNIGRGNLVEDEAVLIDALITGKIGGAVLDVTAREPIPEGHPLWDCPNTILTQHSGGGSTTEYDGIAAFFLENLERFKQGNRLKNVVDLAKGY
ncbi:D-2-hydroxyacid dehydrogenase [Mucilaginibacter ginkgonis]|uniref:D-2-hydroxyacid dehydrogenase n=1 Tax=Mucilaginibacter ginkgonis TaxID=2682091 RepID=A0A6I4HVP5_9SPHI|nr:D-2-hydroxyacid dehydrogenase [Mucilaginibacter ginkgonis]QQL50305.1 D-2-hydroxyacid dehydrogenase [Mucilaginibacter ginkgonis]